MDTQESLRVRLSQDGWKALSTLLSPSPVHTVLSTTAVAGIKKPFTPQPCAWVGRQYHEATSGRCPLYTQSFSRTSIFSISGKLLACRQRSVSLEWCLRAVAAQTWQIKSLKHFYFIFFLKHWEIAVMAVTVRSGTEKRDLCTENKGFANACRSNIMASHGKALSGTDECLKPYFSH